MSAGTQIAALGALAAVLVALAIGVALRVRSNPERRERKQRLRERKRRLHLHQRGRLGDAIITEANEHLIYYSYSIRGVQYTASQDVGTLREHLPADPERLIGNASLKYATNNPANSILICEEWSGLRAPVALDSEISI
ncbi:MAG: hypothetical protein ABSB35_04725 [Bryobacteraceae bacterium]|jgi:hypothetical protein